MIDTKSTKVIHTIHKVFWTVNSIKDNSYEYRLYKENDILVGASIPGVGSGRVSWADRRFCQSEKGKNWIPNNNLIIIVVRAKLKLVLLTHETMTLLQATNTDKLLSDLNSGWSHCIVKDIHTLEKDSPSQVIKENKTEEPLIFSIPAKFHSNGELMENAFEVPNKKALEKKVMDNMVAARNGVRNWVKF